MLSPYNIRYTAKIRFLNLFSVRVMLAFIIYFSCFLDNQAQNVQSRQVRIMFYNCENFFDTSNDSLTNDDEFTPEGERRWTNKRFYQKLNNIFKVIVAVGEGSNPGLIGLTEIENQAVLDKLVYDTPLRNSSYRVVHYESPDVRGIDVALLYRKEFFTLLHSEAIPVRFPFDTASKTRDILYTKFLFQDVDTLHVFVNHWPSRYGGYMATFEKRNFAASVLKSRTDSLLSQSPAAFIICMGDFNDDPADESIKILTSDKGKPGSGNHGLINLMAEKQKEWPYGTLKYLESWNTFDQVIVSGSFFNDSTRLAITKNRAFIYHKDFLLEEDEKYLGQKPFRTYNGFQYSGGFSDHLPVYLDLMRNHKQDE